MQHIEKLQTPTQRSFLLGGSVPASPDVIDPHFVTKSFKNMEKDFELNINQFTSEGDVKETGVTAPSSAYLTAINDTVDPSNIDLLTHCADILSEVLQVEPQMNFKYKDNENFELISKLYLAVKHLYRQFCMLRELIVIPANTIDVNYLNEKYADLQENALTVQTKHQICWPVLSSNLSFISDKILHVLLETVNKLLGDKKTNINTPTNKARKTLVYKPRELLILVNKIKTVSEYIPLAAAYDQTDILALSHDHPDHQDLLKAIEFKSLGSPDKIKASYTKFLRGYQGGISFLQQSYSTKNMFSRYMLTVTKAVYYTILQDKAQKDANLFFSQPDEDKAVRAWNEIDKISALINKPIMKGVKKARRIYIPRVVTPLTLEMVTKALNDGTLNTTAPLIADGAKLREGINPYDILTKTNPEEKVRILVLTNGHLKAREAITEMAKSKKAEEHAIHEGHQEHLDNVPLTISTKKAPKTSSDCASFFKNILNTIRSPKQDTHQKMTSNLHSDFHTDELVIHIHGGGFVAMSADTHQSYTRQWTAQLNRPVLSIDYRLAPQNQYPDALDDCWQAYNWILNHAESTLGIKPNKIVVAGDSAGANLALGVAVLAIKNGIKKPDGLFLAYPALNLDQSNYTPSLINSVEDELLPYTLLKMCVKMYVPEGGDVKKDPLLSPEMLSEDILEQMPMIRMMVGEEDAFKDGCRRMVGKLRKVESEVKMRVYEGMGHGFLGFDMAMGMEEAKECVKDAGEMMIEMFESTGK